MRLKKSEKIFQNYKIKAKLQNLRGKYSEFEPHLEDIIFNLKERLTLAQANKVKLRELFSGNLI